MNDNFGGDFIAALLVIFGSLAVFGGLWWLIVVIVQAVHA
jgi:hypothetical protein